MRRDVLSDYALGQIPTILTLMDRNRHSPTYGCFDRNHWHYKIIDFPSGMAQEFVLCLALAWSLDIPGNPYRGVEALREWTRAGIRFSALNAHGDGSCDDYFPYERAGGATAFSLLACLDAYDIVGMRDSAVEALLAKRADWLASLHESGRLANHQALIALCLDRIGTVLKSDKWRSAAEDRLHKVLSWQDPEGWFPEYEGCDPGYQTLTLSFLARLQAAREPGRLRDALTRGADFVAHFVHPDGSFGGEYGSRNTYNFFPHGFELIGAWHPPALTVNDRVLTGLINGKGACYSDDHIIGHHVWNYLFSWRDFSDTRPAPAPRPEGRTYFPNAGLLVERRNGIELYAALNKGGVFKAFKDGTLVASDTQFSVRTKGPSPKTAIGHAIGRYQVEIMEDRIDIAGSLSWVKQKRMVTFDLILLRLFMVTVGRFFSDLVRRLLQRILITGGTAAPYRFKRGFAWEDGTLMVEDRLSAPTWDDVESIVIGGDQTSIYVVMSRTFHAGQLAPWIDLTDRLKKLGKGEDLVLQRRIDS